MRIRAAFNAALTPDAEIAYKMAPDLYEIGFCFRKVFFLHTAKKDYSSLASKTVAKYLLGEPPTPNEGKREMAVISGFWALT